MSHKDLQEWGDMLPPTEAEIKKMYKYYADRILNIMRKNAKKKLGGGESHENN